MSLGRAPGRTDLAGGEEGRWPGRLRQLPSRGSVNWLVREARTASSPPAGRLACTHTHPHPTLASTRAHPHSRTLAQPQSPSGAGQCDPNAPLSYGGHSAVTGSAPRGRRHPAPPARPFTCARRSRFEPGSRRPGASLRLGGQSPAASAGRSADRGSSPAPQPEPGAGLPPVPTPPGSRARPGGRGGLRGGGAQAAQDLGSALQGDSGTQL